MIITSYEPNHVAVHSRFRNHPRNTTSAPCQFRSGIPVTPRNDKGIAKFLISLIPGGNPGLTPEFPHRLQAAFLLLHRTAALPRNRRQVRSPSSTTSRHHLCPGAVVSVSPSNHRGFTSSAHLSLSFCYEDQPHRKQQIRVLLLSEPASRRLLRISLCSSPLTPSLPESGTQRQKLSSPPFKPRRNSSPTPPESQLQPTLGRDPIAELTRIQPGC